MYLTSKQKLNQRTYEAQQKSVLNLTFKGRNYLKIAWDTFCSSKRLKGSETCHDTLRQICRGNYK